MYDKIHYKLKKKKSQVNRKQSFVSIMDFKVVKIAGPKKKKK